MSKTFIQEPCFIYREYEAALWCDENEKQTYSFMMHSDDKKVVAKAFQGDCDIWMMDKRNRQAELQEIVTIRKPETMEILYRKTRGIVTIDLEEIREGMQKPGAKFLMACEEAMRAVIAWENEERKN